MLGQIQSNLTISAVHFTNSKGVTSGAHNPDVGTIVCSSPDVSDGFIRADDCILTVSRCALIFMPAISMSLVQLGPMSSSVQM